MSKLSPDKPMYGWHSQSGLALAVASAVPLLVLPPNALAVAVAKFRLWSSGSSFAFWDGRVLFFSAILMTPLLLTLHPHNPIRHRLYYMPVLLLLLAFRAPLGDPSGSYQFGILLASWTVRILDRLYLNNPEEAFRYKGHEGISPLTYAPPQKLAWAVELMVVTRGIGWNWQIKQIPPMPRLSRTGFLLSKSGSAAFTIGMLLAIRAASAALINISIDKTQFPACLAAALLHPVPLHVFLYASWAFVVYSSLNLVENLAAILFVGLRITKRWSCPDMWPSVFGHVSESYSIRKAWGQFWHQNMRRVCQSPGNYLICNISFLRNPQTKTAVLTRRYLRLLLTFVFSGIIHAGGSIYMTQHQSSVHDGGNIIGFIYQGFSLIAEDVILSYLGIDDSLPPTLLRWIVGFTLVHGYGSYGTPTLKVVPLARDHGIEGDALVAGLKMVRMGAGGVLKNPLATLVGSFNV